MSRLYAILGIISGFFIALFTAFKSGQKSKAMEIKAETEEAARKYEQAGSEAMVAGLEKEEAVKNETVNHFPRDHFS